MEYVEITDIPDGKCIVTDEKMIEVRRAGRRLEISWISQEDFDPKTMKIKIDKNEIIVFEYGGKVWAVLIENAKPVGISVYEDMSVDDLWKNIAWWEIQTIINGIYEGTYTWNDLEKIRYYGRVITLKPMRKNVMYM